MPKFGSAREPSDIDQAQTLADLLKLLFGILKAYTPKAVADLLTDFDPSIVVDAETAGRWLRGGRRPSTKHLDLIVRLFHARGLIGKPFYEDKLFIRLTKLYVNFKTKGPDLFTRRTALGKTRTIKRVGHRLTSVRSMAQ